VTGLETVALQNETAAQIYQSSGVRFLMWLPLWHIDLTRSWTGLIILDQLLKK